MKINKKNIKKYIPLIIIFDIIICISLVNLFSSEEFWKYTTDISMKNVSICRGPDSVTGEPVDPSDRISGNLNQAYVCGYLDTGKEEKINLSIYLFEEGNKYPVANNSVTDKYVSGPIYYQLPVEYLQEPGIYHVDIYAYRFKIATNKFRVSESLEIEVLDKDTKIPSAKDR